MAGLPLLYTSRHVDGLWIAAAHDKAEIALHRVEEALQLIKTHDRRRYDRLRHDLKRIWVRFHHGANGYYLASLDACELSEDLVLADTSTAEDIATTIVHEATHARLWACGIGYDEPLRQRVEAVCIRRQVAFAARLPNGAPARERAEQALEWVCNTPLYWTDTAVTERDLEDGVEALRRLGTPEWVVRAILALRDLRRLGVIEFGRKIAHRYRSARRSQAG